VGWRILWGRKAKGRLIEQLVCLPICSFSYYILIFNYIYVQGIDRIGCKKWYTSVSIINYRTHNQGPWP